MQHVTAFTRPQTVPAAPAEAPRRNLWIRATAKFIPTMVTFSKVPAAKRMFLASDGKLDQAIAEFQTALKYKPNHPEAHY